jgi:hypothetical protein
LSGARWRWRKPLSRLSPLAREITLVLLLKFLLLWLMWQAFFSQPVAHHMRLDSAQVQRQLLTSPPNPEHADAQR